MMLLDPTNDPLDAGIYRADALFGAPDYVKAAAAGSLAAPDLPGSAYADPAGRRFPTHTKAATWASAAMLHDQRGEIHAGKFAAIESRVRKAAEFWGIEGDVDAIAAKAAALVDDDLGARPDADFMGPGRAYPIRNTAEVKAAAAWLLGERDRIPAGDRRRMAADLVCKSAAIGVDLGDHADAVDRMAGFGACNPKAAALQLRERALILRRERPDEAANLEEAAAAIDDGIIPVANPGVLRKLADAVEAIDLRRGLARLYGQGLDRPDDVFFAVTEKVASGYLAATAADADGRVYAVEDLARLDAGTLRAVGGDALAGRLADGPIVDPEKLAAALPGLGGDDAELFARACAERGIAPIRAGSAPVPRIDLIGLGLALGG